MFPNAVVRVSDLPFPRFLLQTRVHPSSRKAPLQSSFALRPRKRSLDPSLTCPWVSIPLGDITRARRLLTKLPKPRFAPSAGFLNLSTVCSALELAGLFHPAATSRVSLVQGFFLPRSHPPSSGGACPHAVAAPFAHARRPAFAVPRSCPQTMPLDFEALLRARVAFPQVRLFTSPAVASLFEFLLLQVLTSFDVSSVLLGAFRSWCSRARSSRFRAHLTRSPAACCHRKTQLVHLRPR